MGMDAGFDMVPRLSRGTVDGHNWQSFLKIIRERYEDGDLVKVKPNYIEFTAGENLLLPYEAHKFLRFSSKVSGGQAKGVEDYIDTITRVAKIHFGSRAHCWREGADQLGYYSWQDVNDSIRSYEQADEPEIPTSLAQFVLGTDPISELNMQLFDIESTPDKGKALVARFNIAKGKRILCEKPLFTTQNLSPLSVMEVSIATKLKTLEKTKQRQFLSLHNNFPGKYPFSGTVKTNALPCGSGSPIGGVYPTICILNHSCLPNAHSNWNGDAGWETIHATRYIKARDEITISYDHGGPSDSRHTHLQKAFGFNCNCSLCSLPTPDVQLSDTRRLQIQRLDSAIGDPGRVMDKPEDCLADCHRLLQLLHEEFHGCAVASIARLYYDAFQITITHGDQARASVFADKSYRARATCEGEDSPATARVKDFVKNPASHGNFGASQRWRLARKLVPKGVDAGEFDKWLWKTR